MTISTQKTKAMIFNFTKNHQFSSCLQINGENIEIVKKMKILGCIINDTLSWNENSDNLIKKVNSRMQLLRKLRAIGSTKEEMVQLWIVYCRSILEQSCVIWHSSLSKQKTEDLERTQKYFTKLVLQKKYKKYEEELIKLNLISLKDRKDHLNLQFAKKGIK